MTEPNAEPSENAHLTTRRMTATERRSITFAESVKAKATEDALREELRREKLKSAALSRGYFPRLHHLRDWAEKPLDSRTDWVLIALTLAISFFFLGALIEYLTSL